MKPSPEFQLLLLSTPLRPEVERLRELVDGGVDWQAFLDLAAWHRVRPLVYKNLTKACWDLVARWPTTYLTLTAFPTTS
jgi:hypothetical protein